LAALQISWESVARLSAAPLPQVTGISDQAPSTDGARKASGPDRPVIVWIDDMDAGYDKLQEVVFKNEKVALGIKAFRAVKMSEEDAKNDPLLADAGKDLPRLVLVQPDGKTTVLEKGRLTAGNLFTAMKRSAKTSYGVNLETLVKKHLEVLGELDKVTSEDEILAKKQERLQEDDGASARKDLDEVKREREALAEKLATLRTQQTEIWEIELKTA
jgi:hypothetical protein